MTRPTILIIEDEREIATTLGRTLEREGFEVVISHDGQDGIARAQRSLPDLVILDLMLPVIDGLGVCQKLRSDPRTQSTRILMLTARSEEVDEVVGFNMGADDYVTKPFKLRPLVHRIKALLRRPTVEAGQTDRLSLHGIEIDRVNHTATAGGEDLGLTPTEFKLLWTLCRQPGRPFNRHELLDTSRGEDANALERTIDVHIRALRQKLGDLSAVIETVRGVGYRMRPERRSSDDRDDE